MLTIRTVLKFLFFDAEAIRTFATHRSSLWVGFLFVVAAGFAREYDGEYLLAEPWHLAIPLAASLIGCFFMTALIYIAAWFNGEKEVGPVKTFVVFLACYWMTAPMALVYGIPVERFLSPGEATRANLIFLAIVAAWRVLLMIRCVNVLYENKKWHAVMIVALFSDVLAMVAMAYVPGPIMMIMGGVRLTESESLIQAARIYMQLFGFLSMPVWIIGYLMLCFKRPPEGKEWKLFSDKETEVGIERKLLWLAIACSVFWIPFLFVTQPEQAQRYRVEKLLSAEDGEALAALSRSPEWGNFPPHWDLPPRASYGDLRPRAHAILVGLVKHNAAQSLIDTYVQKTEGQLSWSVIEQMTDGELENLLETIKQVEGGREIGRQFGYFRSGID